MNSRKLWWPLADNDQSQQEKFFRWMGKIRLSTGESASTRKNRRMVKKLMCWLLCIWDKDMWKAHQVNVIRHQQILRVKEDGHKSIFLQFYRSYLNISIAQFTPGSAFHKGRRAILGWKNILGWKKIFGWKCQNIFLSPIAELLISNQMTFHLQFLGKN